MDKLGIFIIASAISYVIIKYAVKHAIIEAYKEMNRNKK